MNTPDNRPQMPTIDIQLPHSSTRQARRQLARLQSKVRKLNTKKTPGPNRKERRLAKFKPGRYADLQLESDPGARLTWIKRWLFAYSPKIRDAYKSHPAPDPTDEVTTDEK